MTFSDSRIVKLLKNDFIPVWESVAPVREVTFDLGEGRSVRGAVGGEIALYFCTPQGMVFDIFPALQSPAATRIAMEEALAFYRKNQGKLTQAIVADWHKKRMRKTLEIVWKDHPEKFKEAYPHIEKFKARQVFPQAKKGEDKREDYINNAMDDATRDMRIMAMSKTVSIPKDNSSIMTVIEPGGRGYYRWQVSRAFLGTLPMLDDDKKPTTNKGVFPVMSPYSIIGRISNKEEKVKVMSWHAELKPPSAWKHLLFEGILYQQLKGGKVKYDSESLEAISIFEE